MGEFGGFCLFWVFGFGFFFNSLTCNFLPCVFWGVLPAKLPFSLLRTGKLFSPLAFALPKSQAAFSRLLER